MFPSNSTAGSLVLAPMDGVTDALMREVLTEVCPLSYCVTEFIRVSGLVPPEHVFLREVPELKLSGASCRNSKGYRSPQEGHEVSAQIAGARTRSGAPVQVQLLGGDPTRLADSAQVAVRLGASAIDINFGCPAPTVNRHDGGATLLKYPERIKAIVAAVRSAVPNHLPVSAKLRLGWDDPSAIITNAEMAAEGGASWITIHGRTRMQGYTPPAYWRPIGDVRKALSIPVVANGEIWSLDDLKRCIDQSGCMHFMLGRGVLAQPRLVLDCARYLGLPHEGYSDIHLYSWPNLLQRLVDRAVEHGESERRILSRVKQWLNYAHKHGSYQNFQQMKRVSSTTELYAALGVDERRKECAV